MLPWADSERERKAREAFPFRDLSPEEYAASHAHLWTSFAFDEYRYRDPVMTTWLHRLGAILFRRNA